MHQPTEEQLQIMKQEIETLLKQHPRISGVRISEAVNEASQKYLKLLVIQQEGHIRSSHLLKNHIFKSLPHVSLPFEIFWVDTLTEMPPHLNEPITEIANLKSAIEKEISYIWANVLNHSSFQRSDIFFEIGGDSLKCTQVLHLLNLKYPEITLVDLFKYPSIKSLGLYIESLQNEEAIDKSYERFSL